MDKKLSKMAVPLTVPVGVPSSNGVHLRLKRVPWSKPRRLLVTSVPFFHRRVTKHALCATGMFSPDRLVEPGKLV